MSVRASASSLRLPRRGDRALGALPVQHCLAPPPLELLARLATLRRVRAVLLHGPREGSRGFLQRPAMDVLHLFEFPGAFLHGMVAGLFQLRHGLLQLTVCLCSLLRGDAHRHP